MTDQEAPAKAAVDFAEARAKVGQYDLCPTCKVRLGTEFYGNEFDGVICDDGKAYHHGCEPC